jgi:hypothetical protein
VHRRVADSSRIRGGLLWEIKVCNTAELVGILSAMLGFVRLIQMVA